MRMQHIARPEAVWQTARSAPGQRARLCAARAGLAGGAGVDDDGHDRLLCKVSSDRFYGRGPYSPSRTGVILRSVAGV